MNEIIKKVIEKRMKGDEPIIRITSMPVHRNPPPPPKDRVLKEGVTPVKPISVTLKNYKKADKAYEDMSRVIFETLANELSTPLVQAVKKKVHKPINS